MAYVHFDSIYAPCGFTDGTVDCPHKTAGDMIADAYDFIAKRAGESFDTLDDYLPGPGDGACAA